VHVFVVTAWVDIDIDIEIEIEIDRLARRSAAAAAAGCAGLLPDGTSAHAEIVVPALRSSRAAASVSPCGRSVHPAKRSCLHVPKCSGQGAARCCRGLQRFLCVGAVGPSALAVCHRAVRDSSSAQRLKTTLSALVSLARAKTSYASANSSSPNLCVTN
jgi:hypothetical protein